MCNYWWHLDGYKHFRRSEPWSCHRWQAGIKLACQLEYEVGPYAIATAKPPMAIRTFPAVCRPILAAAAPTAALLVWQIGLCPSVRLTD